MSKCIYCMEDKNSAEFNREHVMPESFGTFENNFTLLETVCKDCNKYFANNLELFLGRDSFEGLLRYKYSVKSHMDFKFLSESRVTFRLDEQCEIQGALMRMKYDEQKGIVAIEPVKQVGFLNKNTNKWEYFEFDNLQSRQSLEEKGFIVKGEKALKMLFLDSRDKDEIETILKSKGFNLIINIEAQPLPKIEEGKVKVEIQTTIDQIICRGIAKIAFNYLTYIYGKEFALDSNFDDIRKYIRYGEINDFRYVEIQKTPLLYFEKSFGKKETNGHLIYVDWDRANLAIYSRVALFNSVFYRVIFCRLFSGVYRPIKKGHHFNVESREITRLLSLPSNFYIP